MENVFRIFNKRCMSWLLLLSISVLSGCASYKAKPLDDFTEDGSSHKTEQND